MWTWNRETWPSEEFPGEIFHLNSEESEEGGGSVPGGGSSMGSGPEGERMFLDLETEIKQVCLEHKEWVKTDEVVRGQGPNLMLFSRKGCLVVFSRTNCLVPTIHEAMCDAIWKNRNLHSELERKSAAKSQPWIFTCIVVLYNPFLLINYITQTRINLLLSLV